MVSSSHLKVFVKLDHLKKVGAQTNKKQLRLMMVDDYPPWEVPYPLARNFQDDLTFPWVGYLSSLEGIPLIRDSSKKAVDPLDQTNKKNPRNTTTQSNVTWFNIWEPMKEIEFCKPMNGDLARAQNQQTIELI